MDFLKAKVIGVTQPTVDSIPDAEGIISYAARVSNPSNQENFNTANKLLSYCAKHNHWSVFETVNVVMELELPRDIARQVLRHRSFAFQEYSGRYAEMTDFCLRDARLQDTTNRQNSIELEDGVLDSAWKQKQEDLMKSVQETYQWALDQGIAKEVARTILPEGLTMSRMYMNGTVRSWMHYCKIRREAATQKEHRIVADLCAEQLTQHFPSIAEHFNP